MKRAGIADAKDIAKRIGADAVIVLAFVDGQVQGASYGEDRAKCQATSKVLDRIVDDMCAGKLPAPDL